MLKGERRNGHVALVSADTEREREERNPQSTVLVRTLLYNANMGYKLCSAT